MPGHDIKGCVVLLACPKLSCQLVYDYRCQNLFSKTAAVRPTLPLGMVKVKRRNGVLKVSRERHAVTAKWTQLRQLVVAAEYLLDILLAVSIVQSSVRVYSQPRAWPSGSWTLNLMPA